MRIVFVASLSLAVGCMGRFGDVEGGVHSTEAPLMECLDGAEYCMFDEVPPEEQEEIHEGGCWITGGGHIGDEFSRGGAGQHDQDSFGFNAMGMRDGRVRGELQNTTHLGDVFHGHATYIRCWKDAGDGPEVPRAVPNNALWGGHGSWNHDPSHTWEAHLADRAEGGSHRDEYELWVWDSVGELVYSQTAEDDLVITGGNFQIHPPNGGHPYEEGDIPTR